MVIVATHVWALSFPVVQRGDPEHQQGGEEATAHGHEGGIQRFKERNYTWRSAFALYSRLSLLGAPMMNRCDATPAETAPNARKGFALGVSAYTLWGVLPVYFKALRSIDAADIVAHRIVWSMPILAALLSFTDAWAKSARRSATAGR